jgi:hypothetical protein
MRISVTKEKIMVKGKFVKLGMAVVMIVMIVVTGSSQAIGGSYDRFIMRDRKANDLYYPSTDPLYISIFEEGAKRAGAPHADLINQTDNLPRDDQTCKDALAWREGNHGQNNNQLMAAVTAVEQEKGVKTAQAAWGIPQTYVEFLCATKGPLVNDPNATYTPRYKTR